MRWPVVVAVFRPVTGDSELSVAAADRAGESTSRVEVAGFEIRWQVGVAPL
jgi:hypothetical protein